MPNIVLKHVRQPMAGKGLEAVQGSWLALAQVNFSSPGPPFTTCMTPGKLSNLFKVKFPPLYYR